MGVGRPGRFRARRGPTTTSAGAACPTGPWHAAVPVLSAAAAVTGRVRLGTLVASPNFRHPVTLAREALALDDVSEGRLDLGLGPGSEGHDATALGQEPWTPAERMARFEKFLEVLRPILEGQPEARTSVRTSHYAATEAPSTPGSVQDPVPLTIAAGGEKGMRLAALHGRHWVTIGATRPRTARRRRRCSNPCGASSRSSMPPAAPSVVTPRASAGCCCGRRPSPCSSRRISSTSSVAPYVDVGLRPVRAPPSGPDGTLRRQTWPPSRRSRRATPLRECNSRGPSPVGSFDGVLQPARRAGPDTGCPLSPARRRGRVRVAGPPPRARRARG